MSFDCEGDLGSHGLRRSLLLHKFLLGALLGLVLLAGCQTAVVDDRSIAAFRNVPRIDPNDPNCVISSIVEVNTQDGKKFQVLYDINDSVISMGESPLRIKCRRIKGVNAPLPVLEGWMAGHAQNYPILIDTGDPRSFILNDIHVLECNLPVFMPPGEQGGVCLLPDVHIGKLKFSNFIAMFRIRHTERRFLGLSYRRDDAKKMAVGLSVLERFKYVAIDKTTEEVEFSTKQSFYPQDMSMWSPYPMLKLSDNIGMSRLFVDINIAGQDMKMVFDTGFAGTLVTTEKVWKQVQQKNKLKTKRSLRGLYGLHIGETGRLRSRSLCAYNLEVGDSVVSEARVFIEPTDPQLSQMIDRGGILGMGCFRDTVVVLDFERNVMLVKKQLQQ